MHLLDNEAFESRPLKNKGSIETRMSINDIFKTPNEHKRFITNPYEL